MTLGISVIICLLILILFAVSEVWCLIKDIQKKQEDVITTLNWVLEGLLRSGFDSKYIREIKKKRKDEETEA